jgi:hypothetical protein
MEQNIQPITKADKCRTMVVINKDTLKEKIRYFYTEKN